MIGIYHSKDFDGVCSGAIMKHKYPEIELIGYDYGEPFPWDKIKGQIVIMADVSLPMPDMEELAGKAKELKWIDHHASAINDYKKSFPFKFDSPSGLITILDTNFSACELCWKHFFPRMEMPLIVEYLGRYDRWDKSDPEFFNSVLMPFQYGMRSAHTLDVNKFPTEAFELPTALFVSGIIEKGRLILDYQSKQDAGVAAQRSFEGTVNGLPAIFCNGVPHNSQSFHSVYDPEKHKLMVPFYFDGKTWNFSLYSTHDDVDCGAIAKLYGGGGGHKGAAGFKRNTAMVSKFLQQNEL